MSARVSGGEAARGSPLLIAAPSRRRARRRRNFRQALPARETEASNTAMAPVKATAGESPPAVAPTTTPAPPAWRRRGPGRELGGGDEQAGDRRGRGAVPGRGRPRGGPATGAVGRFAGD